MSVVDIQLNTEILPKLELNPKQLEAVQYFGGPLLILAGAGTGKTKTLTSKIALLIASGVSPSRVLAITFTNKAAQEMRARLLAFVRQKMPPESPQTYTGGELRRRLTPPPPAVK